MSDMASTETTPLLSTTSDAPSEARPKSARTVTFNLNPVSQTIEPDPGLPRPRTAHYTIPPLSPSSAVMATGSLGGGPPMLSALNHKMRRRNSHSSVPQAFPSVPPPKIGPQRSTKNAQKLKLLPNPEVPEEGPDEESGRDVYSQYTRIKDPTARRDAARLGKADRDTLPRVTAYCTANKYQMDGLMRFLKGRGKIRGANAKLIDECIYTPYNYASKQAELGREELMHEEIHSRPAEIHERRHSAGEADKAAFHRDDLLDLGPDLEGPEPGNGYHHQTMETHDDSALTERPADFDTTIHTPEAFLFDYGVVVIWGMTPAHEQRFLKEIAKFEIGKLGPDDVETEHFNFYYTREYQARIYNDFITLRDKRNYMTKLAISHALAQSVKVGQPHLPIHSTIPSGHLT